jgi:hypothetical protein
LQRSIALVPVVVSTDLFDNNNRGEEHFMCLCAADDEILYPSAASALKYSTHNARDHNGTLQRLIEISHSALSSNISHAMPIEML